MIIAITVICVVGLLIAHWYNNSCKHEWETIKEITISHERIDVCTIGYAYHQKCTKCNTLRVTKLMN